MTREQVMAGILAGTEKLGRVPTIPELMQDYGIDRQQIRRFFGNYQMALEACGLEVPERGRKLELDQLFKDWAQVVRKLKKLPTVFEYEQNSRYTEKPLTSRFGTWAQVPGALKMYATQQGLAEEWRDVMELVEEQEKWSALRGRTEPGFLGGRADGRHGGGPGRKPGGGPGGILEGEPSGDATLSAMVMAVTDETRPVYGMVIGTHAHVYAPTNESGVVCLFGAMAQYLGFMVLRIQTAFPDCEAIRLIAPGRYQRVRIEFEYESRNFLLHMHDPKECDLIVCWEHNWRECPLEVLELKNRLP